MSIDTDQYCIIGCGIYQMDGFNCHGIFVKERVTVSSDIQCITPEEFTKLTTLSYQQEDFTFECDSCGIRECSFHNNAEARCE